MACTNLQHSQQEAHRKVEHVGQGLLLPHRRGQQPSPLQLLHKGESTLGYCLRMRPRPTLGLQRLSTGCFPDSDSGLQPMRRRHPAMYAEPGFRVIAPMSALFGALPWFHPHE